MPNQPPLNLSPMRRLGGLLLTNRAMLFLCINIALLLWVNTKLNKTYSTSLALPLSYTLPKGKTFKTPPADHLDLDIRATGWNLLSLYFDKMEKAIRLDLQSSTKVLDSPFLRRKLAAILSDELEILRFSPESIAVEMTQQGVKKVPIVAPVRETSLQAYQLLKPIKLVPDSVEITGPDATLRTITYWATDSLSLTTLLARSEGRVSLAAPPNKLMYLGSNSVKYSTELEQLTQKNIDLEIQILNASDSVQLFPRHVTVVCTVGLSRYDDVDDTPMRAIVDMKGVRLNETTTLPIKIVQQPVWLYIQQIVPTRADFILIKKQRK